MSTRLRRASQAVIASLGLVAGSLVVSATAHAVTPAPVPVVTVHVNSWGVRIGAGAPHRLHAGMIMFKVLTGKGIHGLQIAHLHNGFTLADANADLNKAFRGDAAAIRDFDEHVTLRGGVETRPNKPGFFAAKLYAGSYVFIDLDGNAHINVTVFGTPPIRARVPRDGSIGAYSYGFGVTPDSLPADGWVRFFDQADQPHFIEFQHVKQSTTGAMVRKAFSPTAGPGAFSFALPGRTQTGILSPFRDEVFHVPNMTPGKYLIACFWPDDTTGMPHAFMGMWKLIQLT